jgi:hypothetical protein
MNIPPDKYKSLMAITDKNELIKIPNKVMRKQRWAEEQDKKLSPNSICIVCNFSYYYKDRGWSKNVKAICHPYREYQQPVGDIKLHLFSESDYCDSMWMGDIKLLPSKTKYKYDFFCFTIDSSQGIKCKGSHSLPLIAEVAKELGMRGLVLDYYPKRIPACDSGQGWDIQVQIVRKSLKKASNIDIHRGWVSQEKINQLVQDCKFGIFPNSKDASPRTIPETLLRGKPIMVSQNVLGGWKYVNDVNGILYDGSFDVEELNSNKPYYREKIKEALITMKERNDKPKHIKRDFLSKYGFVNTAKRMASIINQIEGHKKYKYVAYTDFKKYLKALV